MISLQSKYMKLHHVGIVVDSIKLYEPIFNNLLQINNVSVPFHDEIQKVNVTFLNVGNSYIELIEPAEKKTPVTSFLEKNGSGIHHLGFEVENLNEEINKMEKHGAIVVCKPVLGFENRQISFLFNDSLPVKLIELFSLPK